MSCFKPNQARYIIDDSGKKRIFFRKEDTETFQRDEFPKDFSWQDPFTGELWENFVLPLPCGNCIGCRLDRSRVWAARCVHEAKLYDDNSFVTLTYDEENLREHCPRGSLNRKNMQDFMKRLRKRYSDRVVRTFYAGEYGDKYGRPHFHAALFNLDFSDKVYWKSVNEHDYFLSDELRDIWSHGNVVVGELTWESAAYIARYVTKKVNGKDQFKHYRRYDPVKEEWYSLKPEFSQASLRPGIGKGWFDQFAMSDVYSFDELVINGSKMRPPRYYDKLLERLDPVRFAEIKESRLAKSLLYREKGDSTYTRLLDREKVTLLRMKKLVRSLEGH